MRNRGLSLIVVALVALASHAETQHMPRGTVTDGSRVEVEATVEKTASAAVSDQAIRVVSINGEYNVGVGVVDRAKTAATTTGGSVEHSQITEVCHVIEGKATLATGGTLENARESAPDTTVVKVLNGPSTQEGVVQNGTSRQVGPGDVVIISPEHAALVERDRIAADCLLGGARRSAQSAASGLRGEVNRSRAMEEEKYEA
jgi:hypothetical protein